MVTPKAVFKKSNKRWVWVALCRRTRQIVTYARGALEIAAKRVATPSGGASPKPSPLRGRRAKQCRTFGDFWDAYAKVFPNETHQSVDKVSGAVSHVERWNNTLRQRLARFVRKTLLLTLRRQHVLFPSRKQCMNSYSNCSSIITIGSRSAPPRKSDDSTLISQYLTTTGILSRFCRG